MYWTSSSGSLELQITKRQASIGSHQGDCEQDIKALMQEPSIKRQLANLDSETIIEELKEYGCYTDAELQDSQANLMRLLWIACGDIVDEQPALAIVNKVIS